MTATHYRHIEINGAERVAMLTIESGRARVVTSLPAGSPATAQRIDLLRFTSNIGYFTLLYLDRRKKSSRLSYRTVSAAESRIILDECR